MSPKSILASVVLNLRALGNEGAAAFVELHREDILREIGIAKSTDGEGTRSGVSFGSVSLAKLSKKLAPSDKAFLRVFRVRWAQFVAMWTYVVATA